MKGMRWSIILLVAVLSGCAGAMVSGYGRGGQAADGRSYEEARADNAITARVNTLLVRDRQIRAMDITVRTRKGVVTLLGEVPSSYMAARAGRLAASVAGVVSVQNRLQVRH